VPPVRVEQSFCRARPFSSTCCRGLPNCSAPLASIGLQAPCAREFDPPELARRLRQALKAAFCAPSGAYGLGVNSAGGGRFMLSDLEGTAGSGARALLGRARPSRGSDERSLAGQGCCAGAAFGDRLLVWAAETGRRIAPGFCESDGAIEVEAAELADACPSA
jgi:hypothetical protein